MITINLRDYYPSYKTDCLIEVPGEVAQTIKEYERKDAAYRLRTYRHKAYYSLDREDGIECDALLAALTPDEIYEQGVTSQELYSAILNLPDKQAKRIYAHFILGMTKKEIARIEAVDEKAIRSAIERGLKNMQNYLKDRL